VGGVGTSSNPMVAGSIPAGRTVSRHYVQIHASPIMLVTRRAARAAKFSVDSPPSGVHRVPLYAGVDQLPGRQLMLTEQMPPGPSVGNAAEKVRTRPLRRGPERRSTSCSTATWRSPSSRGQRAGRTRTYIWRHIRPRNLAASPCAGWPARTWTSLYGQLRRCRLRCSRRQHLVGHGRTGEHECAERCRAAPVQAAVGLDGPSDPLDPVRGLRAGRAAEVDRCESQGRR
jgi:hypothetical protein